MRNAWVLNRVYLEPPAALKTQRTRRVKILTNRDGRFGKNTGPAGRIKGGVDWYISFFILNREDAKDAKVSFSFPDRNGRSGKITNARLGIKDY